MPGTVFSYTAILKTKINLKVQHHLPSIGLELCQLGVHTRAKKSMFLDFKWTFALLVSIDS